MLDKIIFVLCFCPLPLAALTIVLTILALCAELIF